MIGSFDKVYTRRGMKVNASKGKVMVFGREDVDICNIEMASACLEQVQNFKYLGVC